MDMALDSSGQPHAAYYVTNNPAGLLKYARRYANGTWTNESVVVGCGTEVAIALDSTQRPHIACRWEGQGLAYLKHNGTAWSTLELVDANGTPNDASIAIDSDGRPHVTYEIIFGNLQYAVRSASGWTIEPVERTGRGGGGSGLVLDAKDRPRVSYVQDVQPLGSVLDLKYAEPISATVLGSAGQ